MPGRIQFDRDQALEAAVKVFWRKGFMGTSMEDIKRATGINESSLYNSFGNKEALYKEALARYREKVMANFAALPNLDHPRRTIDTLVRATARLATTEEGAAGCMLLNSAMELGAEYKDIADYARNTYAQVEEWFYITIKRGQELNEIDPTHNPRALARYLSFNIQGMFAVARTSPKPDFMDAVAENILRAV